ncbi:Polyhydroxyalkanoic acid synthase [Pseudonocardia sp. Ae168_Ps1]|uniref:alpha/beta fold hydrolase n=1 Tax=unclassified Pseudonocardia TaxID=2619320 RepID=UPI00094B155A|nr:MULTISPECIES: alpha/beta fold hydrolase [unclassified Pseudonocardia]OLL71095.1 Polyhydroxyalkanoic acid synthase [Pseudonocardia sp. Ae168_Ps1]OLL77354.1 Polyhydroxyalkanoic acid synthase [Pseudonocardia sp. Ae150A_Ps1]OLL88534.1 Polyhydroxyalkanoic acid synthase [Pseudonocardia sp. Ae263_Ps1]OLL91443.1 Polyhydroxyalkanoic acid synthase [Pseudonocardia sp. Ae356_Ps1]
MHFVDAVANVWDRTVVGHLADLERMPREALVGSPSAILYRYRPLSGVDPSPGAPVLLVPPLGAPDFAYDLRRGCSLVEHLLLQGRSVYLIDYGPKSFSDRSLGMEHWVDELLPATIREIAASEGDDVHLVAWSLGGIFALLTVAAAVRERSPLPVRSVSAIGTPVDISRVPLVAPLRPLAQVTGGRLISSIYKGVGSFPAPVVSWAFQLTAVDKLVTRPLAVLSRIDDRDCLAQIEAVDHLMNNMHGYPGRVFGQIFHLLLRSNDLASGGLRLAGRDVELSDVDVPVLVVAGRDDVIAPLKAVRGAVPLLSGSPEVRFSTSPGGHLGVLTGRRARDTTWPELDRALSDWDGPAVDEPDTATSA